MPSTCGFITDSVWRRKGVTPQWQIAKNIKDAAPAVRAAKLKEQVQKLYEERHKVLRTMYGASPFPEHDRLVDQVRIREKDRRAAGEYVAGLFDLEQKRINHLVCAELEKIIWGETRADTVKIVEKIERQVEELVRTAKDERQRSDEERKRKDLDFLNKNRASVGLPPITYE
jgi:hypothetical protein